MADNTIRVIVEGLGGGAAGGVPSGSVTPAQAKKGLGGMGGIALVGGREAAIIGRAASGGMSSALKYAGIIGLADVLKQGFKMVSSVLGIVIKMLGMLIMPIVNLLIPALMPLIYVLTPLVKMMWMIFRPLFKMFMEFVKENKASMQSGLAQAGAIGGGFLGFLVGGPIGALIGMLIGTLLGALFDSLIESVKAGDYGSAVSKAVGLFIALIVGYFVVGPAIMTALAGVGIAVTGLLTWIALQLGLATAGGAAAAGAGAAGGAAAGAGGGVLVTAAATLAGLNWAGIALGAAGLLALMAPFAGSGGSESERLKQNLKKFGDQADIATIVYGENAEAVKKTSSWVYIAGQGFVDLKNKVLGATSTLTRLGASGNEIANAISASVEAIKAQNEKLKATGALLVDYFAAKIALDPWYAAAYAADKAGGGPISGFTGGGGTAPGPNYEYGVMSIKEQAARAIAAEAAIIKSTGIIPGVATGGVIPSTGLYNLHVGEEVIPRERVGNGGNTSVTINVTGGVFGDVKEFTRQISRELQTELRARNGYGWGQG